MIIQMPKLSENTKSPTKKSSVVRNCNGELDVGLKFAHNETPKNSNAPKYVWMKLGLETLRLGSLSVVIKSS